MLPTTPSALNCRRLWTVCSDSTMPLKVPVNETMKMLCTPMKSIAAKSWLRRYGGRIAHHTLSAVNISTLPIESSVESTGSEERRDEPRRSAVQRRFFVGRGAHSRTPSRERGEQLARPPPGGAQRDPARVEREGQHQRVPAELGDERLAPLDHEHLARRRAARRGRAAEPGRTSRLDRGRHATAEDRYHAAVHERERRARNARVFGQPSTRQSARVK